MGGSGKLTIRLKRAYAPPASADGARVLVDRLWPRGVRKERLQITAWLRDIGPSASLREWFGHDPQRWEGFRRRYREELSGKRPLLQQLAAAARGGTLTLVYGARDPEHNQAVVIKEMLESGREPASRGRPGGRVMKRPRHALGVRGSAGTRGSLPRRPTSKRRAES